LPRGGDAEGVVGPSRVERNNRRLVSIHFGIRRGFVQPNHVDLASRLFFVDRQQVRVVGKRAGWRESCGMTDAFSYSP
jgi:hypothetical protein